MKFVKYNNVSELKLIKNQIAFDAIIFSIFVAVLAWCRIISDNKIIYQRLKIIQDLILQ